MTEIPEERTIVPNSLVACIILQAELLRAHTDKNGNDQQFVSVALTSENFNAIIESDNDVEACEIFYKKIKDSFSSWRRLNEFTTQEELVAFINQNPKEKPATETEDAQPTDAKEQADG